MRDQLKIEIIKFLKANISDILGIYVFGSYADNSATAKSDIDIAFLTENKIGLVEKWKIQEGLASLLDIDTDLIDLKDASTILRTEVIDKGVLIYSNNKYKIDYFEMTTYSMYADLNETRMDIINDYKEKYGRNPD